MDQKQLPANASSAPAATPPADPWRQLWWLPCTLSLELPVAHFCVGTLLRLQPGQLLSTEWSRGAEIPLRANGQLIGWAECEAAGDYIAARITELV